MKTSILSSRSMSTYPVSIGTSFALEAIHQGKEKPYDELRPPTPTIDLAQFDEVWINLITLHRNLMGSISSSDQRIVNPDDVVYELDVETDIIREVIENAAPHIKVRFYSSSYKGVGSEYPKANIRLASTAKQKFNVDFTGKCFTAYYKKHKVSDDLIHFDLDLKSKKMVRALMLTHYAHDLTARGFKSIHLWESHTGVVKSNSSWWTKFADDRTHRVPLNKLTLQIFGDSTLFFQLSTKIRQNVLDIADKHKWNYTTTIERIKLCLNDMQDPYARTILRSMV